MLNNQPYVCVGGVGGSGTRVIAMILASLGLNIGNNLNQALDNLIFTLLFKKIDILKISKIEFNKLILIYEKSFTNKNFTSEEIKLIYSFANIDRSMHPKKWLLRIANNLIHKISYFEKWDDKSITEHKLRDNFILSTSNMSYKRSMNLNGWGWKEPNTYVILEKLFEYYPDMKYIHLIRNGLDMAFSENQNQVKLWGPLLLKESDFTNIHYASLKYWCLVHKKIIKLGNEKGPKQFLLINFDKLCMKPKKYLKKICKFLNISKKVIPGLLPLIDPPSNSIGKFRKYDLSIFDQEDLEYVKKLGFDIK